MASALPDGEPVPADGSLPSAALEELGSGSGGLGIYVHVPFCASRCGYCDFNTYTPAELGDVHPPGTGVAPRSPAQAAYLRAVGSEIELAAKVLGGAAPTVSTVFFGGGTPTMLAPADLGHILDQIVDAFGIEPDAEVTTEANPESVDLTSLRALRRAGFTRISLGMQSTAPGVLALLDRRHTPGRAVAAAVEAREAGFDHVNLDLIYGTPGESDEDFAASLAAALGAGVDHVSAYALTVAEGTRLHARIRRGELSVPDDDIAARRYRLADKALTAAGLRWYEVSNWARTPADRCHHNLSYWRGGHWWGLGPGAHSHVGGVRWWNVRHPSAYSDRLARGQTPAQAREVLDAAARHTEQVMLALRLSDGLDLSLLDPAGVAVAANAVAEGLLQAQHHAEGRAVLTVKGRLLADGLVLRLLAS